jgi:V8-like Glu-specific endopeptidase
MTGFVRLLNSDKNGNVGPGEGSGYYVGDGLILTAGHVVYTFNEADEHDSVI